MGAIQRDALKMSLWQNWKGLECHMLSVAEHAVGIVVEKQVKSSSCDEN